MFLVSCAPKMSDEQLEKDLSKLSPEEQSALLKQAQSGNAVAGNAIASRYATSDRTQLVRILSEMRAKQLIPSCTDSDGGKDYFTFGTVIGKNSSSKQETFYDRCEVFGKAILKNGEDTIAYEAYVKDVSDCNQYPVGSKYLINSKWEGKVTKHSCKVVENSCQLDPEYGYRLEVSEYDCPNGCKDGACLQNLPKPNNDIMPK